MLWKNLLNTRWGARGDQALSEPDLAEIWARSLDDLADAQLEPYHKAWLHLTRPLGLVENTALIATPNEFAKDQLENRLRPLITNALSRELGRGIQLAVIIDPAFAAAPDDGDADLEGQEPPSLRQPFGVPSDQAMGSRGEFGALGGHLDLEPGPAGLPRLPQQPHIPAQRPSLSPAADDERELGHAADADGLPAPGFATHQPQVQSLGRPAQTRLNPKYTFEKFVIGSSNRFAHAAAVAVAEAPAKAYNPLFIYGDSGLGKTHLLHAIGHYAQSLYHGVKVRYVSSEEFTNDFINMIRDGKQDGFRRRYRDVDVLLVDDIQFLENKEGTRGSTHQGYRVRQPEPPDRGTPACRDRAEGSHPGIPGPADHRCDDHGSDRLIFWPVDRRSVRHLTLTSPCDRPPDRDVPVPRADRSFASQDRPAVRRQGPHNGDARGPEDPFPDGRAPLYLQPGH